MKERSKGFLRTELVPHDSEVFDYIRELNEYLWYFVRKEIPGASGRLSYFLNFDPNARSEELPDNYRH